MPLYEVQRPGDGGVERRRTLPGSIEDDRLSARAGDDNDDGVKLVDESQPDADEQADGEQATEPAKPKTEPAKPKTERRRPANGSASSIEQPGAGES